MIRLLEDLNQIGKVLAPFGVDLQANYNSFIPLDVNHLGLKSEASWLGLSIKVI